jgi:hypothetical protein
VDLDLDSVGSVKPDKESYMIRIHIQGQKAKMAPGKKKKQLWWKLLSQKAGYYLGLFGA